MSDVSSRLARLSPDKQALLARQLRANAARDVAEPLAIVGIGCRFPGGADSPGAFWRLLWEGVDAVAEVPAERWSADDYFDPDPLRPGRMNTRWGAWLDHIDEFDARFFGLAPREAARMDPQQRLVLEVCWEALEDAGQTLERLAGSRTGVYVGTHVSDYAWMTFDGRAPVDAYDSTGTAHSIVANRVSYLLDLHGPSLAIDTACSSSLVAAHLACQALRQQECDLAVACGVNLMLSPQWGLALSKLGILSPDGRCKTFDARANGIVRGEGCGAVVLRRLSDAVAAGDPIWAVVRGTATNQDGRTNGLSAPNGLAQRAVVRAALSNAGLEPGTVGAIEAHGTGTVLGDPIEVEALAEVLGQGDPSSNPCVLGSVKTNIGHLEGAAGIAGLIKLALCLHYEGLPKLLHFEKPNPLLALDGTRFLLPAGNLPWPRGERARVGGVSAFGFGGSNAHVVVQEAPRPAPAAPDTRVPAPQVLVVSARSPEALRARSVALSSWLGGEGRRHPLPDICATAWKRRSRLEHGLSVAGDTHEELAARLAAAAHGASATGAARVQRAAGRTPGLAFVFTGQGTQRPGMGRRLLEREPAARECLERCDAAIRAHAGWSVLEEMSRPPESSRLASTEIAQPAVFAIQVAVAAWWAAMGVVPDAVIGHSMGEIAAAHVAGVLSLEEAARVIVLRARLMERTRGGGRMLAVELEPAAARAIAGDHGLSVGAVNSPRSCVLSGNASALEAAIARLDAAGCPHRWLPVEYAFHSEQMEPLQDEFVDLLGTVERRDARLPVASTVTGRVDANERFDEAYWGRNLRETVLFRDAIDALARAGHRTFVEIGPHPALLRPVQQCAAEWDDGEAQVTTLPSLQRDLDDTASLRCALGALHLRGHKCNPQAMWRESTSAVRLPPYPWQRERYALPGSGGGARPAAVAPGGHPLLGSRLSAAVEVWEQHVTSASPSWVSDHCVFGKVVYPAAALLGSAWAAGAAVFGTEAVEVRDLSIRRPLLLDETGCRVQVVSVDEGMARRIRFFSARTGDSPDANWVEHASALVARLDGEPANQVISPGELPLPLDGARLYSRFAALGVEFGPRFRGVRAYAAADGRAVAAITLPEPGEKTDPVPFHDPPLLDACLQAAAAALLDEQEGERRLLLPVAVERAWCRPVAGRELLVEATSRDGSRLSSDGIVFDLRGRDDTGALVLLIDGLHLRPSRAGQLDGEAISHCRLEWMQAERPARRTDRVAEAGWLLLADAGGFADAVADVLAHGGERTHVVRPAAPEVVSPPGSGALRDSLGEIVASKGPWRGVVSFQALDAAPAPYGSTPELAAACRSALAGALAAAQSLSGREGDSRLWLVTRGACAVEAGDAVEGVAAAGLGGLARVVALEHPELRCVRLDVDPSLHVCAPAEVAAELLAEDDELEVALRHGRRLVGRLRRSIPMPASAPEGSQRLERGPGRVLEELSWSATTRRAPGPGEVEIRVQAAGLNFRDVLNALGLYPGAEIPLGNECVGQIVALGPGVEGLAVGDLVVAVAFASIADHVTTPAAMVARKPERLSIFAAATLPIAFLTARYALHELASVRAGDLVLVHAGAGGVGLAAVQLAQRAGATVLATAGSDEKRDLLRRLGVAAVADSRSPDFAEQLRAATGGRGVDVVLNSLSGEFIERSLELTAPGGRFLELGKRDIWSAADVARARPDVAYHVVYLGEVCEAEPERVGRWLRALLEDVASGRLQPLPQRVFERDRAIEAFRYMAQARHVGKVVLQVAREAPGEGSATLVRRGSTHLVTGGLGGVGLAVAEWLCSRGAGALALVGRSQPTPAAEAVLSRIRSRGARVTVVSADVADRPALEAALARVDAKMPPLDGVWHVAGLLADATLQQQGWPAFSRVIAPKVLGAWNLHELTRGRGLDAFVLFSSAAALVGWPGQANYASANASLDALAHYRRGLGLSALSVNWGAWARAGMAASLDQAQQERMERRGMHFMEPARALDALEPASRGGSAQVGIASLDFAAFAGAGVGPTLRRLLADVMTGAAPSRGTKAETSAAPDLGAEIAAAPASRRRALVTARVRDLALRTLGLASDFPLDLRQGLREVGLDSLMAVELRNALQRVSGRPLPSTLLFDFPTVDGLSAHLLEKLEAAAAAASAPSPAVKMPVLPDVSDEDAEVMLRAELAELQGRGDRE